MVHLLTYLLTYTVNWLGEYKTGNISKTVEDRAKVITINGLYIYVRSYIRAFDCRQCRTVGPTTLNDLYARFKIIGCLNAAKMAKYSLVVTPTPCSVAECI